MDDLYRGVTAWKLGRYALLLFGIAVVAGVFKFWMRQAVIGISRHIEYELRNDLFAHLERLPVAYFQRGRTGDLMSRTCVVLIGERRTQNHLAFAHQQHQPARFVQTYAVRTGNLQADLFGISARLQHEIEFQQIRAAVEHHIDARIELRIADLANMLDASQPVSLRVADQVMAATRQGFFAAHFPLGSVRVLRGSDRCDAQRRPLI